MAIGAPSNDGNGECSGHVRVYRLDANQAWKKIGDDIDGEADGDGSAQSVSLSADGMTVAIGAPYNVGVYGFDIGHVRVYRLDDNQAWKKIGDGIDGEAAEDLSGASVSLSADGDTVAIGARGNDGNGNVRVYRLDDNQTWKMIGDDFDGDGLSVSLSADGYTVGIGAEDSVRVYRLARIPPSQSPSSGSGRLQTSVAIASVATALVYVAL